MGEDGLLAPPGTTWEDLEYLEETTAVLAWMCEQSSQIARWTELVREETSKTAGDKYEALETAGQRIAKELSSWVDPSPGREPVGRPLQLNGSLNMMDSVHWIEIASYFDPEHRCGQTENDLDLMMCSIMHGWKS